MIFLAEPNLQTEVLCLESNSLKIGQSDFISLGFLVMSDMPTTIGLLTTGPSEVDTAYV